MFNKILKSSAILAKGSALSSLIIVLMTPLITRYYDPSDFGLYGLVLSISSVVSVGLFFRFELSLSQRKDYEFNGYFVGAFLIISSLLSVILSLIVYASINLHSEWSNDALLITFFVFLSSWSFSGFYLLTILSSRYGKYNYINKSKINRNILISGLQVALGVLSPTFFSLVISEVLGRIYALLYLFINLKLNVRISLKYTKILILRNVGYLRYSFPAAFLNSATINVLPILYPLVYGANSAGLVVLVTKIVAIPISLLGQSLSTSYIGYVSIKENQSNYRSIRESLHKLIRILSAISMVVFLIIYIVLTYFGGFLFGTEWSNVGFIFLLLSPCLYFQIVFSSFSQSLNIFGLQKFQFFWDLIRLAIVVFSLLIPVFFEMENGSSKSLLCYSISMSIMYFIQFCYFDGYLRSKIKKLGL